MAREQLIESESPEKLNRLESDASDLALYADHVLSGVEAYDERKVDFLFRQASLDSKRQIVMASLLSAVRFDLAAQQSDDPSVDTERALFLTKLTTTLLKNGSKNRASNSFKFYRSTIKSTLDRLDGAQDSIYQLRFPHPLDASHSVCVNPDEVRASLVRCLNDATTAPTVPGQPKSYLSESDVEAIVAHRSIDLKGLLIEHRRGVQRAVAISTLAGLGITGLSTTAHANEVSSPLTQSEYAGTIPVSSSVDISLQAQEYDLSSMNSDTEVAQALPDVEVMSVSDSSDKLDEFFSDIPEVESLPESTEVGPKDEGPSEAKKYLDDFFGSMPETEVGLGESAGDNLENEGNNMPVIPDTKEPEPEKPKDEEPTVGWSPERENSIKAEIDAIVNSLNLQPHQKDFLREVSYGAIYLERDGAPVNSEVMIAQAMLESGWNGSSLSQEQKNIFGVKAGSGWKGDTVVLNTREEVNGASVYVDAVWRAYPTYGDAIQDYAYNFIGGLDHYQDAVQFKNDPSKYLDGLLNQLDADGNIVIAQNQEGSLSYATDSAYKQKILSTIEANRIGDVVGLIKSSVAEAPEAPKAPEAESQIVVDTKPQSPELPPENPEKSNEFGWYWPTVAEVNARPDYPGHYGKDFEVLTGTPVYAMRAGTVVAAGVDPDMNANTCHVNSNGHGVYNGPQYHIVLKHELKDKDGNDKVVYTEYAHLSPDSVKLKVNEKVAGGQGIGLSGNSGCTGGQHLHVGAFHDYKGMAGTTAEDTIDPAVLIGYKGY